MVPPCRGGGHGCCHCDTECTIGDWIVGWGVGKGSCSGRIVHPGIRKTRVRQGGQGTERPF